jgi:hypothetical protein
VIINGKRPFPVLEPLTSRSALVNNLHYAYFNRDIDAFSALLDSSFTFVFQEADAVGNPDIPESWTRQDEIAATTNLFDEGYQDPDGTQDAADEIDLAIFGLDDLEDSSWQVYTGPKHFFDINDWYEWEARYHLEIAAGEYLYISDDRAVFVVRRVEVDGVTEWRLVIWRDEDNSLAIASGVTQETTWGRTKIQYLDGKPSAPADAKAPGP